MSCIAGRCVWGNTTWPSLSRLSSALMCLASIVTRASSTQLCQLWSLTSPWCDWMERWHPTTTLISPVCLHLRRSCPEGKNATPLAGEMKQVRLWFCVYNTLRKALRPKRVGTVIINISGAGIFSHISVLSSHWIIVIEMIVLWWFCNTTVIMQYTCINRWKNLLANHKHGGAFCQSCKFWGGLPLYG